jgi:pyrroloquinoline quinone (PQQ) biosynthesis protein C
MLGSHALTIASCSAYELYADPKTDVPDDENAETSVFQRLKQALGFPRKEAQTQEEPLAQPISMAERFKRTFSRSDVKVHFVGAWYIIHSILEHNSSSYR